MPWSKGNMGAFGISLADLSEKDREAWIKANWCANCEPTAAKLEECKERNFCKFQIHGRVK